MALSLLVGTGDNREPAQIGAESIPPQRGRPSLFAGATAPEDGSGPAAITRRRGNFADFAPFAGYDWWTAYPRVDRHRSRQYLTSNAARIHAEVANPKPWREDRFDTRTRRRDAIR